MFWIKMSLRCLSDVCGKYLVGIGNMGVEFRKWI